jgi:hypothetical protein
MVIEETLRLHPLFSFENRNVAADVELGGVRIPQGLAVVFSRYSVLAVIAQRYKVVLDASPQPGMAAHLTMAPTQGVKVRLEAR